MHRETPIVHDKPYRSRSNAPRHLDCTSYLLLDLAIAGHQSNMHMVEPSWSNNCEVSGAALERPTSHITMLYWLLLAISYQWSVGFVCRCCFVFVAPEGSKSIKTSNTLHAPRANGRNHEPLHCAEARSPHSAEVLELRSSTKPRVCKALARIPRMCSILLSQGVAAPRNPDCAAYS